MNGDMPALLVSISGFGWGSLGKARLVLDEVSAADLVLDPAGGAGPELERLLAGRHVFTDRDPAEARAALVVNDPEAADRITSDGVPVIYVDSLPYLWTRDGEVPGPVSVYCAQRWPGSTDRAPGPLAGRTDLQWVDAIAPKSRGRRGGDGVVVNLGGLHSHLSGSASDAYLRLVLLPLARSLAESGRPVAAVCGNLPEWVRTELRYLLPRTTAIGERTPYEFEAILRRADLLLTSPGSTTLIQAAGLGLPVLALPPQNLSQILNTELFAATGLVAIAWPEGVIDRAEIERLRPAGEDAVLPRLYAAVEAAGRSEKARDATAQAVAAGLKASDDATALRLQGMAFDGARQVARRVRQALLAPHAVSRPDDEKGHRR